MKKLIYLNMNDNSVSTEEYTLLELSERIQENKIINSYYTINNYKNIDPDYLYNKQIEIYHYTYKEIWRDYPDKNEIQVSNYGRIKYNDKFLWYSDKGYDKGYLYLRDWKAIQKELKFKFEDDYIYQMVAKTWLVEPEKCDKCENCPLEVHHITNNGYDNSVWNLIYLTKCDHRDVHKYKREG